MVGWVLLGARRLFVQGSSLACERGTVSGEPWPRIRTGSCDPTFLRPRRHRFDVPAAERNPRASLFLKHKRRFVARAAAIWRFCGRLRRRRASLLRRRRASLGYGADEQNATMDCAAFPAPPSSAGPKPVRHTFRPMWRMQVFVSRQLRLCGRRERVLREQVEFADFVAPQQGRTSAQFLYRLRFIEG